MTFEQTNLTAFLARLNSNSLTASDQALLNQSLAGIITNWGNTGFALDPNDGGTSNPSNNTNEWFAVLYAVAEGQSGGGSLVPSSWLQPTWFIDPVAGSDTNNGFTAATALKTWARLQALWGTNAPVLAQNTTITFLSSHTDNTDPVTFRPYVAKGALVTIQGTAPTVITAGVVLAGTTAKNRAAGANTALITTLGPTAAVGRLVQNTTAGKTSRAWAYAALGAGSFRMSQPLQLGTPGPFAVPAEVDTWANGDTVNILQPVAVNIAEVSPTYIDALAPFGNAVTLFQLTIFDPQAAGTDPVMLGTVVNVMECSTQRFVVTAATDYAPTVEGIHQNVFNLGGATLNGALIIIGGAWAPTIPNAPIVQASGGLTNFDGDFILGKATTIFAQAGVLGFVFLDAVLTIAGSVEDVAAISYGNAILYGSAAGQINTIGTARLANLTTHTFTATFTAPSLVTGAQLNGVATGNSVIAGAPDVLNGGITTTVAHLDAAAGAAGFGGLAFNLGGASIASAA